jgi:PTH1 family peptidyl-tRNA hydrolase
MWLIVGLGNPGPEYAWTPHNLGFLVLDRLAEAAGANIDRPEGRSFIAKARLKEQDVLLAKPQTYMNLSGGAVAQLLERFECGPENLIVVFDDVALPWGMIRVRERGSAGGHNGMKSIIAALGTMEFSRVRLGVQPEHPVADLAAYVLRPMRKADLEVAAEMVDTAAEAVEMILSEGVARAMSRFNQRASPADDENQDS